jgi:hypothetical protein
MSRLLGARATRITFSYLRKTPFEGYPAIVGGLGCAYTWRFRYSRALSLSPTQDLKHHQCLLRSRSFSTLVPIRDRRPLNTEHPGKFGLLDLVCFGPRLYLGQELLGFWRHFRTVHQNLIASSVFTNRVRSPLVNKLL